MEFKRDIYKELLVWKNTKYEHKVLQLTGARQVGKTYILNKFADKHYKNKVYINLKNTDYNTEVFKEAFNHGYKKHISEFFKDFMNGNFEDSEDTIIIIDEIQEDAKIFNAIRELSRTMKSHVVVTGSYLGRTMNKEYWLSAGDVIHLEMNVLSFEEFLEIFDLREKYNSINLLASSQDSKLTDSVKNLYDIYSIIGGYPAVVETFIRTKDFNKALVKIKEIVSIFCQESLYYFEDINDVEIFTNIFDSITRILIREKKGLESSGIGEEIQKIIVDESTSNITKKICIRAINWLYHSKIIGSCNKVINCNINDVKLNSRLYFRDLGVTSYFLNKINASKSDKDGLINETFVYNCLYNHLNDSTGLLPTLPTFATLNSGELDFILKSKYDNKLYGIEVKTGKNIEKTINKALELNKIDFAINVKGNTQAGFNEAERKYTIPIYLFSKFKFDLGEEEIDGTEALKKLIDSLHLPNDL